jgi:hypothetical protein
MTKYRVLVRTRYSGYGGREILATCPHWVTGVSSRAEAEDLARREVTGPGAEVVSVEVTEQSTIRIHVAPLAA